MSCVDRAETPAEMSARLHDEARLLEYSRYQLMAEEREREEAELHRACTFAPVLPASCGHYGHRVASR